MAVVQRYLGIHPDQWLVPAFCLPVCVNARLSEMQVAAFPKREHKVTGAGEGGGPFCRHSLGFCSSCRMQSSFYMSVCLSRYMNQLIFVTITGIPTLTHSSLLLHSARKQVFLCPLVHLLLQSVLLTAHALTTFQDLLF